MNTEFLAFYDLDKSNPIDCFEYLVGKYATSEEYTLCMYILSALHTVDNVITEKFQKPYIYIQNDSSIKLLLQRTFNTIYNEELYSKCLFILDISKLIYRFTCAKKFEIQDDKIKQFRINSWGNEYLIQKSREVQTISQQLHFAFNSYCNDNFDCYSELVSLLSLHIDRNVAYRVIELNSKLELKLLS